jgi:4a-hydroxytetrahydrobiopterin dehydratase
VHKLIKEYKLLNFVDAIKFVNQIAEVAENEGHHPNISIRYNIVLIEIYTHAIDGLSENDFILASKIDETFSNGFINN